MIRLKCSKCGKVLSVNDEQAGGILACGCGHRMRVPGGKTPKPALVAGKGNPALAKSSGKSAPKKGSGKTAGKPDAKPAASSNKPWQGDDDFNPYTLQPEAAAPPPIRINRGGEDDDEGRGRGKKKKKPQKESSSTAMIVRLSILLLILAVLGGLLIWKYWGGEGTPG